VTKIAAQTSKNIKRRLHILNKEKGETKRKAKEHASLRDTAIEGRPYAG
jgi:hypothetical protein